MNHIGHNLCNPVDVSPPISLAILKPQRNGRDTSLGINVESTSLTYD